MYNNIYMKKNVKMMTLLVATFGMLSLFSCNKESKTYEPFVGEYDIVMSTDSLGVDGDWFDKETYCELTQRTENDRLGTMTIELDESGEFVNVVGNIDMGAAGVVPLYSTTGKVDENGNLILAPSKYSNDNMSYTFNYTYGVVAPTQPLVFRSEMHAVVMGMDCGYIYTNTCTKK